MPLTPQTLLDSAREHFRAKQNHVAIVCAGPRSEQWFNGEVRIGLNERYAEGTWKWITVEKVIDGGRIDVFAMDGDKANQADGAVEGKHAQQDDTDAEIRGVCEVLRQQMEHRKLAFPSCPVIGLIYATFTYKVSDEDEAAADDDSLACPIVDTEGEFYKRVRDAAVTVFGDSAVSRPDPVFAKARAGLGKWQLLTSLALIAVDGDAMTVQATQSGQAARPALCGELGPRASADIRPSSLQTVPAVISFDWSGEGTHADRLQGIACYVGNAGGTPERRVSPDSPPGAAWNWTRQQVCDFVVDAAAQAVEQGVQVIAGFDFPFSFPWSATGGVFPDGQGDRATFWHNVHAAVWPNGTAQGFVNLYPKWFAENGRVGADYALRFRFCEQAAREAGAQAKSVFNLRGVAAGKGSICGIAVLQQLVHRCRGRALPLMIWPFFVLLPNGTIHRIEPANPLEQVPAGCLIVVETYPRVHWGQCGQSLDNFQDPVVWNAVANHFSNAAPRPPIPAREDQADALVAWYGLAAPGSVAATLSPTMRLLATLKADPSAVEHEGWIYGV